MEQIQATVRTHLGYFSKTINVKDVEVQREHLVNPKIQSIKTHQHPQGCSTKERDPTWESWHLMEEQPGADMQTEERFWWPDINIYVYITYTVCVYVCV